MKSLRHRDGALRRNNEEQSAVSDGDGGLVERIAITICPRRCTDALARSFVEGADLVHAVTVHALHFGFSAYPPIPEVRLEFTALRKLHHHAAVEKEKKDLNDDPENIEKTRETWWFWLWIQFLVEHGLFPFL